MTDINCEVSIFEYFQKKDTESASWKNLVNNIYELKDDFNDEFDRETESLKEEVNNSIDTISITGKEQEIAMIKTNIENLKNSILNIYNSLPDKSKVENFESRFNNFNPTLITPANFLEKERKIFNELSEQINELNRENEKIINDIESISINNDSDDVVILKQLMRQRDEINQDNVELQEKIERINNKIRLLTENTEQLESKIKELKENNFDNLKEGIDKLKNKIIKNNVNLLQHRSLLEMYNIKLNHHKKLKDDYNNENNKIIKIIKKIDEMIQKESNKLKEQEKDLQSLEKQLKQFIEKNKNFDEKAFRKKFLEKKYDIKSVKTPKKSPGFGYKDDADGLDSSFEVKIEDLYGDNEGFKKMGEIFSSANYIRKKEMTDFSKIEEFNNQLNVNIQGMNAALNNLK